MARHWRGEYKQARGLLCDLEPLLLYIQEEQGPKTLTPDLHQFMNEIEEAREFLRLTDSSSVDGEGK